MDKFAEIVRNRTGNMVQDIKSLKEATEIGDEMVLELKDSEGRDAEVNARVVAKYPYIVKMEYTVASGRRISISFGWNKLMLMLIKGKEEE